MSRSISACWHDDDSGFTAHFIAHMEEIHRGGRPVRFSGFLKERMTLPGAFQAEFLFRWNRPAYLRAWFDAARRHFTRHPGAMVVEMRRNGTTLHGDLSQYIPLWIFVMGAFEPELVRLAAGWLTPGDTVLDLGAYIGSFTLPLAAATGATVHCAEPNPSALGFLKENIKANGLVASVHPYGVAVCAQNGPVELSVPRSHDSMAALGRVAEDEGGGGLRGIQVKGIRFDEFLRLACNPRPTLIKMDVEGFEMAILKQMQELLQACAPALLLEVNPGWLDASALFEFLWDQGYQLSWITRRGISPLDAPPAGPGNIWCVPTVQGRGRARSRSRRRQGGGSTALPAARPQP